MSDSRYSISMDDNAECYVICGCSQCRGKEWHDEEAFINHFEAIAPTEGFEVDLINVSMN